MAHQHAPCSWDTQEQTSCGRGHEWRQFGDFFITSENGRIEPLPRRQCPTQGQEAEGQHTHTHIDTHTHTCIYIYKYTVELKCQVDWIVIHSCQDTVCIVLADENLDDSKIRMNKVAYPKLPIHQTHFMAYRVSFKRATELQSAGGPATLNTQSRLPILPVRRCLPAYPDFWGGAKKSSLSFGRYCFSPCLWWCALWQAYPCPPLGRHHWRYYGQSLWDLSMEP